MCFPILAEEPARVLDKAGSPESLSEDTEKNDEDEDDEKREEEEEDDN